MLPFVIAGAAMFVLLAGTNLPAPLYAVYQHRFGFSDLVLTLVFATYAAALAPSLLLFGQLSDRLGRRIVIAGGLGVALVGLVLFALAQGTAWLFVARAVQGVAVGAISGTATAALVELEPGGDRRLAALPAGLAQAGGSAGGAVFAGALAEWAPAPRVLCYVVWLAVTAAAALGVSRIPESVASTGRWRPQRPSVGAAIRRDFTRVSVTAAAVWAVAALFLSVVPSYVTKLLATHDLALVAALSASMLVMSCCGQLLVLHAVATGRRGQAIGLALLAVGLVVLVLAFPAHSLVLVLVAAVLAGVGHGVAFVGSQTELNELAPEDRRGEVTAAYVTTIYAAVGASVVGVGVLTLRVSLFAAVAVFAATIGAAALGTATWHLAGADVRPAR
jgi:MFS family permease